MDYSFSDLWVAEAKNKYCTKHRKLFEVSKQEECQAKCAVDSKCVGISFGYRWARKPICFICLDSILSDPPNVYRMVLFYRKKG